MSNKIKTTVVGSYPVPKWLVGAQSSSEALRDAITVVLRAQEGAGIEVVTDGELSRFDPGHPETNGMIDYFVAPLSGIDTRVTREELSRFRSTQGLRFRNKPAGVVRGQIGEGTLNLPEDWNRVKELARNPAKFTVTSPYMLAKTLIDSCYGDFERLLLDLAEALRRQIEAIDAPVLQVDEANLPGSPQDGTLAARAINHLFSSARNGRAVHLCFGNYGGQSVQKGLWRDLLPFFNLLDCDHLVLEFARRGYDEIEAFRDLKPEISLGVGVIDIKDNGVETPETVASRIERAVKVLGERVGWVHPDCGFWMLPRGIADAKMRNMVLGRNLFLGIKA